MKKIDLEQFLVADYLDKFHCKNEACRSCCYSDLACSGQYNACNEVKAGVLMQGGCANSCEKVLELLFDSPNKLSFYQIDLPKSQNLAPKTSIFSQNIQDNIIDILQNRNHSLDNRIKQVGEYLKVNKNKILPQDYNLIIHIWQELERKNQSFAKFSKMAKKNYGFDSFYSDSKRIGTKYTQHFIHFNTVLPNWEIYMEKLLINYLTIMRFPNNFSGKKFAIEYLSFYTIFSLTMLILVGYMADKSNMEDFIDCIVGLFRCFEDASSYQTLENILLDSLILV